jgi:4-hydroxybenzoate polyprenyltransferase
VGIKTTALLFGEGTKPMLALFFSVAVALIGVAASLAGAGIWAGISLLAFAAHLGWQVYRFRTGDPDLALRLFKSNRDAGLILFAGFLLESAMNAT